MTLRALFALLLVSALALPAPAAARQMDDMNIAVLRTIDKVSARTGVFEIPVDKTVQFGASLFIRLRACRKAPPLEPPESAAFLQVWEKKPGADKSEWVFSGWMFASSPSLSNLEHPVYDVWLIDCKNAATAAKSGDFSSESAPEGAPAKTDAPAAGPSPETEPEKEDVDPGGD